MGEEQSLRRRLAELEEKKRTTGLTSDEEAELARIKRKLRDLEIGW